MKTTEEMRPSGAMPWQPPGIWLLEINDHDMGPTLRPGDFVEVDGSQRDALPTGMWVLAETATDGTERLVVRRLDRRLGRGVKMVMVTCDSLSFPDRLVPLASLDIRGRCVSAFLRLGPNGELRTIGRRA